MKTIHKLLLLLGLIIFFSIAANAQSCVKVKVSGFRAFTGQLFISIYKTEDAFLKVGKEIATRVVKISDSSEAIVDICDLPSGWYAVALYHDEDSNNKMNTGFFGIPREPYGLSNNIHPRFSYPKFNQCKFYVPEREEKDVAIALVLP